jgi:hypothetical protein
MDGTPIEIPKKLSQSQSLDPDTGFKTLPGTESSSTPVETGERHPTAGSSALAPIIEIDKLYSAPEGSKSALLTALGLLADSIDLLTRARIAAQKGRLLDADRETQRFEAILPALFRCRKIGDGYAVVVNSLHFAAINKRGGPLNLEQLTTVWRILRELRNKPFVEFEQALEYVEEFEACGLQVDPPIVSDFLEILENER